MPMGASLLGFDALARLPAVRFYETAFRKATGVPVKMVPPVEPKHRLSLGAAENRFCALMARTATGCYACLQSQSRILQEAANHPVARPMRCFAGLTDVAVPVLVAGRPVAILLSGQIFRRQPNAHQFARVLSLLGDGRGSHRIEQLRQAYFAVPVVSADRFQAIAHLLTVFAQYVADLASRHLVNHSANEPCAVHCAKEFVQAHFAEPLTLGQVAQYVHVNRFYFCRLFKQVTGMTLTKYISHVRVTKAKMLLGNPAYRISEVVFAVGFGSIPRFNAVFKRQVGVPPRQYRLSGHSQELPEVPRTTVS